ncbi:MAG: cyclic pyranopterin monophosphate synthase MoaC [Deltaproteobacteria bacterium]|nr:cyclic pyranopterin monophosphate synthase MoaC [Deltaproteobacteria bacterium]MBW2072699.1 cyclic pyranopterin monophosphate synthase MoaC [Deltaproteobacteria bacterium]
MEQFTHIDEHGQAHMVDIGDKPSTERIAVASGRIRMRPETLEQITSFEVSKGDVLGVARLAGIMAAKKTSELIPLCHPLRLSNVTIDFTPDRPKSEIVVQAMAKALDRTGVEMEALVAVSIAALTVYDMCKSYDRDMQILSIQLLEKRGGKSGHYRRDAT